jgi:putative membrane-bound dehydrogenase-like protein
MKDTDGDGRVDVDELWFDGFAEQNSQLRANHPRLALDNWIYVANGLRGGQVINRKLGEEKPINISGMDFRFNPLTGAAEAVSGNGQFGLCFDDWGNRFTCSNRNPVRHVVIEDRYLKANPSVTVPATVNDVAAFGEQSRIFPISRAWTTSNLHAGQFTAACGVYIYRGDLLPAEFKGNAFTCDPTGNLIHREIVEPAGPTFKSKPAYEGKEFLASPDEWFRPVNMELGPDGALYVVDMYRCVIEHPDFVPEELKKRPDLRLGDDRGRIWRIVANTGDGHTRWFNERRHPALSKVISLDLVPLLEHPNAWQRDTAQRLLLERQNKSVERALEKLFRTSQRAEGRVHAARAKQGLDVSDYFYIAGMYTDEDPHVRRQGILLYEDLRYTRAKTLSVHNHLYLDSDHSVRFQAMLTGNMHEKSQKGNHRSAFLRGLFQSNPFVTVSGTQIREDSNDPWMRIGLRLHRPPDDNLAIASFLVESERKDPPSAGEISLARELAEAVKVDSKDNISANLHRLLSAALSGVSKSQKAPVAVAALHGLSRALARQRMSLKDMCEEAQLDSLHRHLMEIIGGNDKSALSDAIGLISYLPASEKSLVLLSNPEQPQATRLMSISALARQSDLKPWQGLLEGFPSETPPIRRAVVEGLLTNLERTKLLLDLVDEERIKPAEIDLTQVRRLTNHRDASIKQRAEKLFAAATPADRAKALEDYQPVLSVKGNAVSGQAVFEKNCAACHRIAGIGSNVAPDISDSRTKKYEQLLADIIQPNRAIDNNYLGYTVRLADGQVLTGILTAETATSITLRQQGGKDAVIPRAEVEELKSTGQSLMPEGLERNIPPQEMADLLAFIKNWRYLDGRTPLSGEGP